MNSRSSVKCAACGELHDSENMEVSFNSPDAYLEIAQDQRIDRVRLSDDLCTIDDSRFFVRGVIPIPVPERGRDYRWGVWAEIAKEDFRTVVETWSDEDVTGLAPLAGVIANAVPEYQNATGLALQIQLRSDTRPFMYIAEESEFQRDQISGVTLADLDRYFHYIP